MKCRTLHKLLPELIAGELNNDISARAYSHVEQCATCRQKLEQYRSAIEALEAPKCQLDVPMELNVLEYPAAVANTRRKPAFVISTAAAATVLIGLGLGINNLQRHSPGSRHQINVATGLHNTKPTSGSKTPEKLINEDLHRDHNTVVAQRPTNTRLTAVRKREVISPKELHKHKVTPVHPEELQSIEKLAKDTGNSAVKPDQAPVALVVASQVEDDQSEEMSVGSCDSVTDEMKVYKVTTDDSGNVQSMTITILKPSEIGG